MKASVTSVVAILIASQLPLVAAELDLTKLPPPAGQAGVTYAKDIRPLFEASCINCHGERRQRAAFGIGRFIAPGMFSGFDRNTNGSLTRAEMTGTFSRWYSDIDTNKTDKFKAQPFVEALAAYWQRGTPGNGGSGGGPGLLIRRDIAAQMIRQGDQDKNNSLSKTEFVTLSEIWFGELDADKSGQLNEEQFVAKFGELLGGNAGAGRTYGPRFFAAIDADKDGSLTRGEFRDSFDQWFVAWNSANTGALDQETLYAGLRETVSLEGSGGRAGTQGGARGTGQDRRRTQGGGRGPGGGDNPAPARPLSPEQVGLVRAWIDQGAK